MQGVIGEEALKVDPPLQTCKEMGWTRYFG
jgi:hypothetical protein